MQPAKPVQGEGMGKWVYTKHYLLTRKSVTRFVFLDSSKSKKDRLEDKPACPNGL